VSYPRRQYLFPSNAFLQENGFHYNSKKESTRAGTYQFQTKRRKYNDVNNVHLFIPKLTP
jgi:hypothetical protein